jgi:signal transduction histidine kinase
MSFLHQLVYTGVHFANTASERRSILLSNLVSLILFTLGTVLFGAYYLWYGWSVVTAAIPVVSILCLSGVLLNHFNKSVISRVVLCLLVPVAAMSVSIYAKQIYYSSQEELDYFTFRFLILASCIFPAVFFSFREAGLLIGTLLVGFTVLMLHDPLHDLFGVPYRTMNLKVSNYYFTNVVTLITYLVLMSAVLFLKKISEQSEERAEKLIKILNGTNSELIRKNEEIEAQNHEITAQTENLNLSQKKLQDAYQLIAQQKELLLAQNRNLSSEIVEMNQDLSATNSELIKHNNELRQFSYTVSHNLRGPVASLSGLISLIDATPLTPHNAEIFRHIKTSISRLEAIIKDLTKIIDIRHEIFHIRQKIDLVHEVNEILSSFRREIDIHDIVIHTDLTDCTRMYSVKPMVHSILYNLLANAIKYRAPDRRPEIRLKASQNEESVVLEVTDNGLGIDLKNQQQNLFKLYKRFHYHTEGKGLGLYLVKLQVESLGGRIDVESEINRFTTFTVTIPKPGNVEQQVLFQELHAKIYYDARVNSTGVVWNGPVSSEQFRLVLNKCLEFIKAYNTPNYISDQTNQGYITRDDQHWLIHDMMLNAAGHGLKKIAVICKDNDDGQRGLFQMQSHEFAKLDIDFESFTKYSEAIGWIEEESEKSSLRN